MLAPAIVAVLWGLAAAVAWGGSDFFAAKSAKRFGGLTSGLLLTAVGSALYILVFTLFLRSEASPSLAGVAFTAAGAVALVVGLLLFFKGLEYGPVSIVSPLGSTYPLVTTLVAVLVFGAVLSAWQLVGIALVVSGSAVASGILSSNKAQRHLGRGPLLALLAAPLWGVAWALMGQAVNLMGWQLTTLFQMIFTLTCLAAALPFILRRENALGTAKQVLAYPFIILGGVGQMFGSVALNIGLQQGSGFAAIAVAMSACYPVLTIILALANLKEKVHPIPLLGALAAVGGVVVLVVT